jgi:beta-lactamase superfamily II metal-dependent hydrolase
MPRSQLRKSDGLVIEMLPAREGDCLVVSYPHAKRTRRILIDGGRKATYQYIRERFADLPKAERTFELLVVTHIDRDHIEGVLEMLRDDDCPLKFRDIWFNGYSHLQDPEATREILGGVQGELLTEQLRKRRGRWNARFERRAVMVRGRKPRAVKLDGGLEITILSPDADKLAALADEWLDACQAAGLDPELMKPKRVKDKADVLEYLGLNVDKLAASKCDPDKAHPNGSSIGLLVRFGEARVLLAADCHPDRLIASLRALQPKGRIELSAFKLPHHGSERNLPKDLLDCIDCDHYLVSTNGAYFKHPTKPAIARVLKYGSNRTKHLYFNYRSKFSRIWNSISLADEHDYVAHYPERGRNGTIRIELPT